LTYNDVFVINLQCHPWNKSSFKGIPLNLELGTSCDMMLTVKTALIVVGIDAVFYL